MNLPITISGSYDVPSSIRSGDALHSFNRRTSDNWGGYMLGGTPPDEWKKYIKRSHGMGINDVLIKAYKEGYNPDVKIDKIEINGWNVKWSATIFENKNGKAYIDVSSRGSFSGTESDAKNRGWSQIKKGGAENSINAADENGKSIEPWTWLYDLNYKENGYIRQWFYKRTDVSNYPPHNKTKGTKNTEKKSTSSKSEIRVDYIIGDYVSELDSAMSNAMEKEIKEELCDIFMSDGIFTVSGCFYKYTTTVDTLIKLYDQYNSKTSNLITLLKRIGHEKSVDGGYYESMYDYNDEDAVTKHDSIICELSDPDCLDIALCWMEDILLSMDKC
jgi:hypothetical protein